MKYFTTFFILLCSFNLTAQNKQLQLSIGYSKHGTGDMRGYSFSVDYSKKMKKKFEWTVSIGSTIHDYIFPLVYEYPVGNTVDASIRSTTAGIQSSFSVGYCFLNSKTNKLKMSLGGLIRYQSSSYYDAVAVLYPALTSLPYPVVVFQNTTPQKTVSIGAIANLSYNYKISPKLGIGTLAAFQFDSNGDNISQLSISLCRYF